LQLFCGRDLSDRQTNHHQLIDITFGIEYLNIEYCSFTSAAVTMAQEELILE
jgi:hypothetical protein